MNRTATATVCMLGAALAACATPPPAERRAAVRDEAQARLGIEVSLDPSARTDAIETILADGVLTADEAVRLAIANNSQLQALLENLDIARAEVWQASLLPNPVMDAEVQFIESDGGDLLELGLTQSIIDVLLIPRRKSVASARYQQVEAEVTAAILDLATEVRDAYRTLQAQLELVELYRTATDATYYGYDAARRLREAGNIIELDVLTEQALHQETRTALVSALARAGEQRENMNALLGIWDATGSRWTVPPRLPMPTDLTIAPEDVETSVIAASLDLAAMHSRVVALGRSVDLREIEATFPVLSAGITAEREADETWSGGPLVSFSLPIFDYGQAAGEEARSRFEQAYAEYTALAIRLRRSARAAFIMSSTTSENSRYLRDVIVPLRSRITQQTQMQFNAMQIGVFQVLDARRREIDAARSSVESLRDHWIARNRLESLLLGRLPQARFGISTTANEAAMAGSGDPSSGGH